MLGVDGFSYIDGAGSVIIAGPFESADEFHEGVAVVYGNQSAWYIDRTGQRSRPGCVRPCRSVLPRPCERAIYRRHAGIHRSNWSRAVQMEITLI